MKDKIDSARISMWRTQDEGFSVLWDAAEWGFGTIDVNTRGDNLAITTENMGKEFVEAVFKKLLDDASYTALPITVDTDCDYCHQLCVEATKAMIEAGSSHHVSYISSEDIEGLKEGGRIPRVTIEWVDESETYEEE